MDRYDLYESNGLAMATDRRINVDHVIGLIHRPEPETDESEAYAKIFLAACSPTFNFWLAWAQLYFLVLYVSPLDRRMLGRVWNASRATFPKGTHQEKLADEFARCCESALLDDDSIRKLLVAGDTPLPPATAEDNRLSHAIKALTDELASVKAELELAKMALAEKGLTYAW
jgi:hypothetical protein